MSGLACSQQSRLSEVHSWPTFQHWFLQFLWSSDTSEYFVGPRIGQHLIALSASRLLFRYGIAFLRGIGGKTATPEEISETTIGSKGIPFRIHWREDQMHIVRIIGSLQ